MTGNSKLTLIDPLQIHYIQPCAKAIPNVRDRANIALTQKPSQWIYMNHECNQYILPIDLTKGLDDWVVVNKMCGQRDTYGLVSRAYL